MNSNNIFRVSKSLHRDWMFRKYVLKPALITSILYMATVLILSDNLECLGQQYGMEGYNEVCYQEVKA